MRRLFLIRHAKAEPSIGRDDYERALTERGRDDAAAGRGGARRPPRAARRLIHSGAARAKETAEIFAGAWPRGVELQEDPRALRREPTHALRPRSRAFRHAHARVGLVGHNPGLGELAVALAGSGAQPELRHLAAKYPTGAVAVIDFSRPPLGGRRAQWPRCWRST